jgi:hypothetical protein
MVERRTVSGWAFVLAGWLGAIGLMVAVRLIFGPLRAGEVGTARVLIPTLGIAVAIGWTFVMAVLAFRRLDEYQVAAGKFAWYWGGSAGLAVSAVAYGFIALGGLHWLDPAHFHLGRDLFRAFQIGYLVGVGFPVVGLLLVRLWWQVAKR